MSLPDAEVTLLATSATEAFFANTSAVALGCKAAANPAPVGSPQPTKACSQVVFAEHSVCHDMLALLTTEDLVMHGRV